MYNTNKRNLECTSIFLLLCHYLRFQVISYVTTFFFFFGIQICVTQFLLYVLQTFAISVCVSFLFFPFKFRGKVLRKKFSFYFYREMQQRQASSRQILLFYGMFSLQKFILIIFYFPSLFSLISFFLFCFFFFYIFCEKHFQGT